MNKKMLSRIMTSLLAGVMTVGMLAGCGNQDVNEKSKESESQPSKSQAVESTDNVSAEPQEITYPLTDAEDVSWFVVNQLGLHSEYTDASQSPFHSGLSEMTGINIDWQFVPQGADSGQTLELLIQEEDCPNILFWSGFIRRRNITMKVLFMILQIICRFMLLIIGNLLICLKMQKTYRR